MGTSFMKFRGKGFWIHDSIAELWYAALIEQDNIKNNAQEWIIKMRNEIEPDVKAEWIMGLAGSLFDKYLTDDFRRAFLLAETKKTNKSLHRQNKSRDYQSRCCIASETNMIENLLTNPDSIPEPGHIFNGKKWIIA